MKVKCDYCGNYIDESDQKCSFCGAANTGIIRTGNGVPKTIEELKQWYLDHNLPDENITRYFIGKNFTGPKAYGIYKDDDSGDFIVYKNKTDGSRMVRYAGNDEAYAVQELYLSLKEAVQKQKNPSSHRPSPSSNLNANRPNNTSSSSSKGCLIAFIIFIVLLFVIPILLRSCGSIISSVPSGYHGGSYYNSDYGSYDSYSSSDYDSSSSSSSSWWDSSWDSDDWDSSSSWDSWDSWDSDWDSSSSWDSWDSDW